MPIAVPTARTPTAERAPWWLGVAFGLGCAVLGAVVIFRPFTSLGVLLAVVAIGSLAMAISVLATRADTRRPPWARYAAGAIWLALGATVLIWPDITTRALAVAVGATLAAGGILDIVAGIRGTTDERLAAAIGGAATVIFGLLAMGWPSVTILVVAVVFGFRLVLFGVRQAWSALRRRAGAGLGDAAGHRSPGRTPGPPPRGRLQRLGHVAGAVLGLVAALGLAGISASLNAGTPVVDAFYDTPDDVPDRPGQLLAAEAFTRTIPDDADAWRILYTTTRADGVPAVASAIVVVPTERSGDPLPVIALAHGTTGVARNCAPSVLDDPFAAGAFFALGSVLDEGWALVATDYVGLGTEGGHPYLVGEPAGRSVLDSVLAARQLTDVDLAEETVVWGHSQGGAAALWTGGLAPSYAPEAGVIGVAALAPASDLVGLADGLGDVTGGSIFAGYLLRGYANAYPDVAVGDYVAPTARATFDASVGRCLAEPAVILSALGSVTVGEQVFSADLASGPLLERVRQNVPTLPIAAPLLVAQGEDDSLILAGVQADYIEARCAAGQAVDYRTYPGLDHVPLVEADSPLLPELFQWTRDRFGGADPTPTCGA